MIIWQPDPKAIQRKAARVARELEADVISETDLKDLPIAAPLRALRAALKEEP